MRQRSVFSFRQFAEQGGSRCLARPICLASAVVRHGRHRDGDAVTLIATFRRLYCLHARRDAHQNRPSAADRYAQTAVESPGLQAGSPVPATDKCACLETSLSVLLVPVEPHITTAVAVADLNLPPHGALTTSDGAGDFAAGGAASGQRTRLPEKTIVSAQGCLQLHSSCVRALLSGCGRSEWP